MEHELRIRAERQRRGWSQTVLGARAGMATSEVSRIETGRLRPYPNQLRRLAKALDVPADELLKPAAPAGGDEAA
jgi:XRE family transcriptional regulator, regulator of sulfur utilization